MSETGAGGGTPGGGTGRESAMPTYLGMPSFPEAARDAVADARLRHNLAHATTTIRGRRSAAVAELDDWEALREAGRQIKDHVLDNLGHYLRSLEERVIAAGGEVHWARDAAEANRIVTELVLATGEPEVVKVKSMATQEIGLNEALAEAGITAHETDLAELIVQLGDDRPSHILVPAIHHNRSEIRDLFRRRMPGVPPDLSDAPAELAEAARRHLRAKFLSAKVAVSGVNFAVADTGTLVVLESEGNGRMCLTLPETLISVMGVEKIVPSWRDLEVFLQLLPRSSTAERMNPYTSTWTGVTPGDGPREFHLVLLDNGRTATLADQVGRQALRCIRCSACLNVCPVYARAGGHAYGSPYPGPIGAILSPQLRGVGSPIDASLPYASSLCGACFDACPVAIDIPEVLVHLRTRAVESGPRHPLERAAMWLAAWTLRSPDRLARAQRAGSVVGGMLGGSPIARRRAGGRGPRQVLRLVAGRRTAHARTAGGRTAGGRTAGGRTAGEQATRGRTAGGRPRIRRLPGPLRAWTDTRDAPLPPPESFRAWWIRTGGVEEDGG